MGNNNNELIMAKVGVIAAVLTLLGDLLALILAILELKDVLNPDKNPAGDIIAI